MLMLMGEEQRARATVCVFFKSHFTCLHLKEKMNEAKQQQKKKLKRKVKAQVYDVLKCLLAISGLYHHSHEYTVKDTKCATSALIKKDTLITSDISVQFV